MVFGNIDDGNCRSQNMACILKLEINPLGKLGNFSIRKYFALPKSKLRLFHGVQGYRQVPAPLACFFSTYCTVHIGAL